MGLLRNYLSESLLLLGNKYIRNLDIYISRFDAVMLLIKQLFALMELDLDYNQLNKLHTEPIVIHSITL